MATSDNYELQDDQIPVFLINGFLEAGKTEFIKYTMAQDYFQTEGTTLLLLCEEGESEYEEAELLKYGRDSHGEGDRLQRGVPLEAAGRV